MTALQLNFRRRITALKWLRWLLLPAGIGASLVWPVGPVWLAVFVVAIVLVSALRAWEMSARRQFIREATMPRFLVGKLCAAYPDLKPRDAELVLRGLRQFFMAYLRSNRKFVAMPSKLVDAAWHEFILHTHAYQRWCTGAFGSLLHHSPAEVLGRDARRNDGLRRTWYWACKEESINPRTPARLPLLFALDRKFGIPGGFSYVPDCSAINRQSGSDAYCGTSFGASGDGSGDAGNFGGSESSTSFEVSFESGSGDSGDSGGCGGGCGGD